MGLNGIRSLCRSFRLRRSAGARVDEFIIAGMAWLRRFVADQREEIADSFCGKALYVDTETGELRMQISGVVMLIDAEDG